MYRIEVEAAHDGHLPRRDRWNVLYSDGNDHEVCVLECPEEALAFTRHLTLAGSPAVDTAAFYDAERGAWLLLDKMRSAAAARAPDQSAPR